MANLKLFYGLTCFSQITTVTEHISHKFVGKIDRLIYIKHLEWYLLFPKQSINTNLLSSNRHIS